MIFEEEVPVFPQGVLLGSACLLDTVTGDRVPINETARLMLSLIDGRRTAREIGEAVAERYSVAPQRVIGDFLQLIARLNEKCMLNVATPPTVWPLVLPKIVKAFVVDIALGHLRLPLHRKRLDFPNTSGPTGFVSVVRQISLPAAVMGGILSSPVWLLADGVVHSLWTVVSVAVAFAVSLVLHEAAHAVVLAPVPAFLSLQGPVFLVGHRKLPPDKGFLVSAAGPVMTGSSGLLLMLMSALLNSEYLVFAGEILSLNLLGMTAIAADGRKALRDLALVLDPPEKRGGKC